MQIVSKNLIYSYDRHAKKRVNALDGVSLTISGGDFFGIIGHTGSGKSTFIQHLNALVPAQNGELCVGEFNLVANDKKQKKALKKQYKSLRKAVGMVFQYPEYQLFAETVFDDVAFGLKNFQSQLTAEQVSEKVKKALETVGLDFEEVKNKSPFDLSGGQKRRVAIAGVIVSEPDVLVLDEPVAGLDPQGKKELWKILHELNDGGKRTVIVVSHDMDDVLEHCNRIAVFSKGKVIFNGETAKFFIDDELVKRSGLELPTTIYLFDKLKELGVDFQSSFLVDDFVNKICETVKQKKKLY